MKIARDFFFNFFLNHRNSLGETKKDVQRCSYPGSPAHASISFLNERLTPGTVASYTCDNGYELLGPSRRVCQQNGTWTPLGIPFCGENFFRFLHQILPSFDLNYSLSLSHTQTHTPKSYQTSIDLRCKPCSIQSVISSIAAWTSLIFFPSGISSP